MTTETVTATARAQIDAEAFVRGWRRWCSFGDLESCRSEDERTGFRYASRENEVSGSRPRCSEASDALADFIRLGSR